VVIVARVTFVFLCLLIGVPGAVGAAPGTITTAAGTSPPGYAGDGGPATAARMNEPRMMAFDPAGNMYVVDTFNHLIRRVDPGGTVTTVAGRFGGYVPRRDQDCKPDFSGEGVPATQAHLSCPHGVAADSAGNLYIADSSNDVIRKVDPAGVITTLAGKGGVWADAGDGGPAAQARLADPKSVVFDRQGNLLVADSGNDKIKRIDMATGVITTIAGTEKAGFSGDGGPAPRAQLNEPRTLAVGADGTIYFTEPKSNRVRMIQPSGVITTFAGTGKAGFSGDGGPATRAQLNFVRGVGVDGAGAVFLADSLNQRIRKVDARGVITTVAGRGKVCYFGAAERCGDGGPALQAGFATPRAVDVDGFGNLFVADTFNQRIRRIDSFAAPVHR
jgi:sugar lactone lactonase YvrE